MAKYGANYPCFKPSAGSGIVIGKLVSANMTIALATGEIYADDELAEKVSEFSSGSIAMETDDLTDSNASVIYGARVDSGRVIYNKGDTAPIGKLAYYKALMRSGVKYYQGYYYPKVQAALGNDNAQTKGSSVTFQTTSTTFTVFPDTDGNWRETETFTTEAAARAWCANKCEVATYYEVNVQAQGASTGESVSPLGTNYVAAGDDFEITIEGYTSVTAAYDNGTSITSTITGGSGTYTVSSAAADHDIVIVF